MEFLKEILSGRKLYFKNSEVRRVAIPRYRSITVKTLVSHALSHSVMKKYLPRIIDMSDPNLDRNFICSIVNTIDCDFFPDQLARIESERKLAQDRA